jgi:hypothetical protein
MITYEEFIILKEKLENNEISLEKVKEICSENLEENKKSWNTKDWKERRKQVIKDSCEQCGIKEDLVLKNYSIPKKFANYYFDSYMHFYNILREENECNFDNLASKEDIENYINKTLVNYLRCVLNVMGIIIQEEENRILFVIDVNMSLMNL